MIKECNCCDLGQSQCITADAVESCAKIHLCRLHCVRVLTDRFIWQCYCFIRLLLWWRHDERITDYSRWTYIFPALCCVCRSLDWRL